MGLDSWATVTTWACFIVIDSYIDRAVFIHLVVVTIRPFNLSCLLKGLPP